MLGEKSTTPKLFLFYAREDLIPHGKNVTFITLTEIANQILYPASCRVEKKGILEQKIFIENALKSWGFKTHKYSNGRRLFILYVCISLLL